MQALSLLRTAPVVALTATLPLAVPPSVSAETPAGRTVAKTQVRILDSNLSVDDMTETVIRGTVESARGRCEVRRLVVITMTGSAESWRVRAQEFGRWHLRLPTLGHFPGQYTATAPRHRVGDLRCRSGSDTQYLNVPSG